MRRKINNISTSPGEETRKLILLFQELYSDIDKCEKMAMEDQFARRTLFRTFFALVEATTYRMRQILLAADKSGYIELNPKDKSALEEKRTIPTEAGHNRQTAAHLPMREGFKLTVNAYAKLLRIKDMPRFDGPEWQAMQRAMDVRDAITHPKELSDVNVEEENMKELMTARDWFYNFFIDLSGYSIV